jgi:GT2 family glycosyltransferase
MSGQDFPRVSCVILNWNGWKDTLECLASLAVQDYPNLEILVVDNGSTNDSVERIRTSFPGVRLVETHENLGYSKGCNVGLREALKAKEVKYLWLLNNDTVCPPDTVSKLVRCAEANPDAGLVGTVLYFAHDPAKVQAWGGGTINPLIAYSRHFFEPTEFGRNSYLTFASVLARRKTLEEIGLLYEGAFMYCEDSEFCLRMQETRWKIVVAEDTAVLHKEGGSSGNKETFFMSKTLTFAGLLLIRRHSRLAFVGIPAYLLLRTGNRVYKREWQALRGVWQAAKDFMSKPVPSA